MNYKTLYLVHKHTVLLTRAHDRRQSDHLSCNQKQKKHTKEEDACLKATFFLLEMSTSSLMQPKEHHNLKLEHGTKEQYIH